jgi:hypothetical protein
VIYRSIPRNVEAVRVRSVADDGVIIEGAADWLTEALEKQPGEIGGIWPTNSGLRIGTLEGVLRVNAGDYIVKGVMGEIYPVHGDIFQQIYEPVDAP